MEFSGKIFGNIDDYRFSLSSEFFFNSSSRLRLFEPFLLDFSGFKETPACGVRVIGCANIEKCHPIHYLKQAPEKVPSGCLVWGMGICPLVGPTQAPPSCRCTSRLATSTLFAQCHWRLQTFIIPSDTLECDWHSFMAWLVTLREQLLKSVSAPDCIYILGLLTATWQACLAR